MKLHCNFQRRTERIIENGIDLFYPSNLYRQLGIGKGKIAEMQHRMGLMAFAFNWKVSSS